MEKRSTSAQSAIDGKATAPKSVSPPKSRLGRGLASLIPPAPQPLSAATELSTQPADPVEQSEGNVREMLLSKITPNTLQPRTEFDPAALAELVSSITLHGVLQPVMVRPLGHDRYELVAGERRFRAAQSAGLTVIPAVIREMTDEESLTVALIENIQREDLNAIEAARGYQQLLTEFKLTQSELARQIGKAQPTISNVLRLLKLPPVVQESISSGRLTEEHGKALLMLEDAQAQEHLWRMVLNQEMTVAQTRRRAQELVMGSGQVSRRSSPKSAVKDVHWRSLEDQLRLALGLKVTIVPKSNGRGVLQIDFAHADELEDLLEKLQGRV